MVKKIIFVIMFFITLGLVLGVYYLDDFVKYEIVSNAEDLLGVKVEIGSLHVSLTDKTLVISDLNVGDFSDPYKNMLSWKSSKANLDLNELLRLHYVINDMTIDGLTFGTRRKTSGIIGKPPAPIKLPEIAELERYYSLPEITKRLNIAEIVDLKSLKTLEKLDQTSSYIKAMPILAKNQIASANIDGKYLLLKDQWATLMQKRPQNAQEGLAVYQQMQGFDKQIQAVQLDIRGLGDRLVSDYKGAEIGISQLKAQSEQDFNTIKDKISLAKTTMNNLFSLIIGEKYKAYIELVRVYAASYRQTKKKISETKPSKFQQGFLKLQQTFFRFSKEQPKFLIKKLQFNGYIPAGTIASNKMLAFSGTITEIASDPDIRKLPTKLIIESGSSDLGNIAINGVLDYRNNQDLINISFTDRGINLGEKYWDTSFIPFAISSGSFDLDGSLSFTNGKIASVFDVKTKDTAIVPTGNFNKKNLLHQVMYLMTKDTTAYLININQQEKDIKVSTNLDKLFEQASQQYIKQQEQLLIASLTSQWDGLVSPRIAAILADYKRNMLQVTSTYSKLQTDVNAKLNSLQQEVASKQKEVENTVKQQKSKAQEQVNEELQKQKEKLKKSIGF